VCVGRIDFMDVYDNILNTTQKMYFTAADTSDKILANIQGPTLHYILRPLRCSSVYCTNHVYIIYMYEFERINYDSCQELTYNEKRLIGR